MSSPTTSPKYIVSLVEKIKNTIWSVDSLSSYKNVMHYISRWQNAKYDGYGNPYDENFEIHMSNNHIDLDTTLQNMPEEYIIRIANDLGIKTPGFLPIVPERFENILIDINQTSYQNFERAVKNVYENPDESVLLASSTLDGIIKTILKDEKINVLIDTKKTDSLTKQANSIIKVFKKDKDANCPKEILTLAGNLNSLCNVIDNLRSDKTPAHGATQEDYIIDDPLWASLVVNITATLGLFLWEYFDKKYGLVETKQKTEYEYDISEIPF